MRTMTWYSLTVEAAYGDEWRPLDRPCTQVAENIDELVDSKVVGYDLKELDRPWRVRVYAGYNRYDDLVAERTSAGV